MGSERIFTRALQCFRIKSQVETIYNLYSLIFVAYIMSNNVKFKLLHKVLECVVKGP